MGPGPDEKTRDDIAAHALLNGLTDFASRARHDLVGPLSQAGTLLALFVRRHEQDHADPEAGELIEMMRSSSARLDVIVSGIRRYMEVASRPPAIATVDLNSSLAASLARLGRAVSESRAAILSDPLPLVTADATHMTTVFELLVGNSIRFCRAESPPQVRISSRGESDRVTISVEDNGMGIEPEYCERVLLPFVRIGGVKPPGAGLGLAISKLIAEMHGGSLRIAPSAESCGVCVQFTVRLARPIVDK